MGDRDPSAVPDGLVIEAVDWLPSGGRSGLVRVRGTWAGRRDVPLPELIVERGGELHRLASLPDPGAGREPGAWRGAYVVHADLAEAADVRLRLEFPGGARIALPRPVARDPAEDPTARGGDVVDRAVLADRRARRAEAAEAAHARIAREALKAVEVLELRAAQLEEQLESARAERDALSAGAGAAMSGAEVTALRGRLATAEAEARAAKLRAEAAEQQARVAPPEPAEPDSLAAAQRRADRLRDALTASIGVAGSLRLQLHEARVRARTQEITHAAERVRLTVLASERAAVVAEIATLRRGLQEAERRARERAAAAERADARAAGAEAAHEETRRRFSERAAELGEARETIARLEAELAASRAEARRIADEELPAAVREALAGQEREMRDRHEQAEQAFAARAAEAQAALAGARAELERVQAALARAETGQAMAEAAAAGAAAELRAADVARASLAAQVARLAEPGAADELADARAVIAAQAAELEAAALAARVRDEEVALARREAEAARAERDARERELASAQAALEALEQEAARAAAVHRDPPTLTRRSIQAEPWAPPVPPQIPEPATEPPPERVVADLDAAAAALRARAEPPAEEEAPGERPRATIVSAATAPGRVATGRGAREYPALRGALVKLAHDDAQAAARLLAGLLPAQWRAVSEPVDYDLTIAEVGTFAITVTAGAASVRPIAGTRSRAEAEFHLRSDALTLAEMLAGVGPRPRRFGRAKVSGRSRRVRVIQQIPAAEMSLADVVRAGARLEPELVLRTLAYAVHPSWTKGHDFTIAQTFTGPEGEETLYITAADGRGLTVGHEPPPEPPRTRVLIARTAFEALLRGEAPAPGERPVTRGDHRATDTLRAWADRARSGEP